MAAIGGGWPIDGFFGSAGLVDGHRGLCWEWSGRQSKAGWDACVREFAGRRLSVGNRWKAAGLFARFLPEGCLGDESVLDSGLAIPATDGQRSVEILISSASARVEGTVTDKNDLPAAGAIVALVPEKA